MHKKRMLVTYEIKKILLFVLISLITALGIFAVLNDGVRAHYYNLYLSNTVLNMDGGCLFGDYLCLILQRLTPLGLFVFGMMALVQFSDTHNRKAREYMASLPFTRKRRFLTKVAVGYGLITVWSLFVCVGALCIQKAYWPAMIKVNLLYDNFAQLMGADTYLHTIRTIGLMWLIFMAMYSVYVFTNVVIKSKVVAFINGLLLVICPFFSANVFYGVKVSNSLFNYVWLFGHKVNETILNRYFGVLVGAGYGTEITSGESAQYYTALAYGRVGILYAIVIAILVVTFILAFHFSHKTDAAMDASLIPSYSMKIAFSALYGWLLAIGTVFFIGSFKAIPIAIVVGIIVGILAFVLIRKR